jgi:transcriptional regulator with XRE-family HTH domain
MQQQQVPDRLSDQLRHLIRGSGISRYRLAQDTGIDQAMLSRFMAGKGGLSMNSIDALAAVLRISLALSFDPQPRQ